MSAFTSSCYDDETERDMMSVPVSLYIPVENGNDLKSPGDPGTTEQFSLPEYAYVYIVLTYTKDSETKTEIFPYTYNLDPSKWEKITYSGSLQQSGDYVYKYNDQMLIYLPLGANRHWGRVYAAVSKMPLSISSLPGTLIGDNATTMENYVKNLTFNAGADNLRNNMQDIYSTPYNYTLGDPAKYYGTIMNIGSPDMSVNLMLYHVAAKVDLIWNVDSDTQSDLRITEVQARNQFGGQAFLFRPCENERSSDANSYHTTLVSDDANAVGSQWLGRAYYYTIPFKDTRTSNTFNISVSFKNGANDKYYTPVFSQTIADNTVFTPWVRGNINFQTATHFTQDNP